MDKDLGTKQTNAESLEESLQQAIFEGFVEVPMLPEVAGQALSLAHDPEASAAQMAELIERDQSLAGHVMRIANSVAYTPLANLVSLQQAVARLGMNVISEIALTAALSAKLFNTPGYEDYVEFNWQHAIATSLWSKEIAKAAGINTEAAFLAGLLHSIGRPAVLQTMLELSKQQGTSLMPETVYRLENKYSQPVTELVVTRWGMPAQVVESIKHYEQLDADSESAKLAASVHAASRFATYMLDIAAEDDRETLMDLAALEVLGLDDTQIEQLLEQEEIIQQRLTGLSP
ncbi:HDOD domain-containing protein [Methylophaga sp.]|jgi:HD-like signal output (HDOD) protein|uniref:HDOD domain-containing protein n=1 Tax=Methylophaga sp. TaxID=2024840 RepID=UPI0014015134|nr:HDOD domain-containing protein [Methylophaga sp.]MTI62281.1 HDOD domain-containing protein [Methylophaga sp.]